MGLLHTSSLLDRTSPIVGLFKDMFTSLGDKIAQQYGGSVAHKGDKSNVVSRQMELLTSVQRYYSNSFTDRTKQDAINIFLGSVFFFLLFISSL